MDGPLFDSDELFELLADCFSPTVPPVNPDFRDVSSPGSQPQDGFNIRRSSASFDTTDDESDFSFDGNSALLDITDFEEQDFLCG